MVDCKNCDSIINENFCARCGQPAKIKRIDRHYIAHEIQHLLHVEKGFLYTAKMLLTRPGSTIRDYLTGSRSKHMKPIPFLVFSSLLYTLIAHFFHIEAASSYLSAGKEMGAASPEKSSVFIILGWIQGHYGYANMIAGGVVAGWAKIFFRKSAYNIFEINILLCFVMGEGMLIGATGLMLAGLTGLAFMPGIMSVLMIVYNIWAIGQFFNRAKASSYIKALLAYMLGFITFIIGAAVIGIGYDIIRALIGQH